MRNKATGKYEVRKFFPSTGQEIIGVGDTNEEAKKDLKEKVEAYRKEPLVPTGEYVSSPGYARVQYENGRVRYEFRSDRKAQIRARPELAAFLKKEREEAEAAAKAETTPETT